MFSENLTPLLQKLSLKSLSQTNQDGFPSSSWGGAITWNLSHILFSDFLGKIMMFLQDYDVITRKFPQNWGFPMIFVPISCQNVRSYTLIRINDTCFVQNFIKI